jgi:hypothetical protein
MADIRKEEVCNKLQNPQERAWTAFQCDVTSQRRMVMCVVCCRMITNSVADFLVCDCLCDGGWGCVTVYRRVVNGIKCGRKPFPMLGTVKETIF